MHDYLIKYKANNMLRSEMMIADSEEQAIELFRSVHPLLTIVSVKLVWSVS